MGDFYLINNLLFIYLFHSVRGCCCQSSCRREASWCILGYSS